jgi:hypothetical protein
MFFTKTLQQANVQTFLAHPKKPDQFSKKQISLYRHQNTQEFSSSTTSNSANKQEAKCFQTTRVHQHPGHYSFFFSPNKKHPEQGLPFSHLLQQNNPKKYKITHLITEPKTKTNQNAPTQTSRINTFEPPAPLGLKSCPPTIDKRANIALPASG